MENVEVCIQHGVGTAPNGEPVTSSTDYARVVVCANGVKYEGRMDIENNNLGGSDPVVVRVEFPFFVELYEFTRQPGLPIDLDFQFIVKALKQTFAKIAGRHLHELPSDFAETLSV